MDPVWLIDRVRARRDFIVTPYRVEGDLLIAEIPGCCLAGGDDCHIRVHHHRPRKTGPRFPLCVVECVTHHRIFTLYPPGYVPYGRVAIAPVGSDGVPLADDAEEGDAWERTLFRALQDAARGIAWPRRLEPGDGERGLETWRTQGRRIRLAASLLGVLAEPERAQPAVAATLGIPTLTLRDAAMGFLSPGWRRYTGRGRALQRSHRMLADDRVLERLLAASVLVAQSGTAHRWDPTRRELRGRGPP
jgi:hypothetical protein